MSFIVFLVRAGFVEGVLFDIVHVVDCKQNGSSDHTKYVDDKKEVFQCSLSCHVVYLRSESQILRSSFIQSGALLFHWS